MAPRVYLNRTAKTRYHQTALSEIKGIKDKIAR